MASLSLFARLRRKIAPTPLDRIAKFLSLPEHAWIARDRALLRSVALFLSTLPERDLALALGERRLLLLYCNQRMSCSLHQFEGREIVLIFPELCRLLSSARYLEGHAVLAHEIAHVLLGHTRNEVDALRAQLEADDYARRLGLGEDLASALRREEPGEELAARLAALAA
jgi:hypothetical protein